MNKFAIVIALVAVLVGLVAISGVSGSFVKKSNKGEHFEHEGGEVEKSHHPVEHKEPKGKVHQPHPVQHQPPRKPKSHHYRPHHRRPNQACHCPEFTCHGGQGGFAGGAGGEREGRGFEGRGGVEGRGAEGEQEGRGFESRGFEGRGGAEGEQEGRGFEGRGGVEGEQEGRSFEGEQGGEGEGSFRGAGFFGGFRNNKEFDADVRADDKRRNRNQFQKNKGVFAGEQKSFNAGGTSAEANSVEGFRKRKNVDNDRLVVKETNRGNEDTDAFRKQNGQFQEGHVGASDNKFFGAQAGEAASSEQDSDKEFEADVRKKDSTEGFGGAGVVKGQF